MKNLYPLGVVWRTTTLSPSARLVLGAMAVLAPDRGQELFWASSATLAKLTGLSGATIRRCLREIEDDPQALLTSHKSSPGYPTLYDLRLPVGLTSLILDAMSERPCDWWTAEEICAHIGFGADKHDSVKAKLRTSRLDGIVESAGDSRTGIPQRWRLTDPTGHDHTSCPGSPFHNP